MEDFDNRPFDLGNPHKMREALQQMVHAYLSFQGYWLSLEDLTEGYDQTVEDSDFATWIKMGRPEQEVDSLVHDTVLSLQDASDQMHQNVERATRNMLVVLRAAVQVPPDFQLMVLGGSVDITVAELENDFSDMLEGTLELSRIEIGDEEFRLEDIQGADGEDGIFSAFLTCFREFWQAKP